MRIGSRPATRDDLSVLVDLYRRLESEQTDLKRMWPLADGLAEPVETSFGAILEDDDSVLVLGTIDDVPLGLLWARVEDLLPQANGAKVGAIRLVFTDHGARAVGVGESMIDEALSELRGRGVRLFDAHVSPGHRLAKNFFESHGFSARSIVMHHEDE